MGDAAKEEMKGPGDRAGEGAQLSTHTCRRKGKKTRRRQGLGWSHSKEKRTERRKRIFRAEKRHQPTDSRTQQIPSRNSKCASRRSREKLQKTRTMETKQPGAESEGSSGLLTSRCSWPGPTGRVDGVKRRRKTCSQKQRAPHVRVLPGQAVGLGP